MPKTLVDQARYQFRNWKCDAKIHSSFADMRDLGKSFFATMVLPKYGIMNSDRSRTIPWHSLLYDKIEEAFVVEVLKHKANYPQTTDDEKYDTELKFHIMSHGMANFISERNHKPYTY